jgi:hypothetical protein
MSVCEGWARTLLCAGVIFSSFFLHELARYLAGRACGYRGLIVLTALGPNTQFEPYPNRGAFVLLRLTGPVASLAVGSALAYAHHLFPHTAPNWMTFGASFNLAWFGISLLPIGQFDGGRVLERLLGEKRSWVALLISSMVGEATTTVAIVFFRSPELALLLLLATIASALQWLQRQRRLRDDVALAELRAAQGHLQAGRHEAAREIAKTVSTAGCSSVMRNEALHVLAWAALGAGDPKAARKALEMLMPDAIDAYTLAAVESASGCPSRAIQALDRDRRGSDLRVLSREAARLLIDLHAQAGDFNRVAATAIELFSSLGREDVLTVARALAEAGQLHLAVGVMGVASRPSPVEARSLSSVTALKPILRK